MAAGERFEWSIRDGVAVVAVSGEVDLANSERLRDCCRSAIEAGGPRLVVDVSGVTFMDSSALGALVRVSKRVRADDGWLRVVVGDNTLVRKLLAITGLTSHLGAHPTVADALRPTTEAPG